MSTDVTKSSTVKRGDVFFGKRCVVDSGFVD